MSYKYWHFDNYEIPRPTPRNTLCFYSPIIYNNCFNVKDTPTTLLIHFLLLHVCFHFSCKSFARQLRTRTISLCRQCTFHVELFLFITRVIKNNLFSGEFPMKPPTHGQFWMTVNVIVIHDWPCTCMCMADRPILWLIKFKHVWIFIISQDDWHSWLIMNLYVYECTNYLSIKTNCVEQSYLFLSFVNFISLSKMAMKVDNEEFWHEFIRLYGSLPATWKIKKWFVQKLNFETKMLRTIN